ncbi:MAG TPA: phosphoribosyltransferase family protein [Candidatus Saccharimonadales bacterium]|nr:phosphoribosyltransferase family protein [Candidatus Saccharimonadales bacterium]
MSILEQVVRIFAPLSCIGCGTEQDVLLCDSCAQGLETVVPRCYRCKRATFGFSVCADCQPTTPLRSVVVGYEFDGLAKDLVHRIKYERAQAGTGEIARLISALSGNLPEGAVLVSIPTASSRVRARGYDHTALLTRALAQKTGRRSARLLGRRGQAHQVGSGRTRRLSQLSGAYYAIRPEAVEGRHLVLVDDILTTGATLETAAHMLLQAGARRVDAIVFAQA